MSNRPLPQGTTARSLPQLYQIEIFAGCNLRCPLCHAGREEIGRETKFLTLDRFKIIFGKIEPYAELIYLHIWGEPTLNKHLIDMVEYIHKQKPSCKTNVSTHGNGLSKDYMRRLIGAGLSQLIVSIDGANQATYEKYRVGGRFDQALSTLRWASEAKTELNSPIAITAQCIQMKQTIDEAESFRKVADFPGVSAGMKPLYIGGYGMDYQDFIDERVEIQHPTLAGCTALSDVIAIQTDGSIIPCCLYPQQAEGFDLGNIFEESLEELFARRDRWEMERRIHAGDAPTRVCANACGGCASSGSAGRV